MGHELLRRSLLGFSELLLKFSHLRHERIVLSSESSLLIISLSSSHRRLANSFRSLKFLDYVLRNVLRDRITFKYINDSTVIRSIANTCQCNLRHYSSSIVTWYVLSTLSRSSAVPVTSFCTVRFRYLYEGLV